MATRRTTRRSLALEQGVENDLANRAPQGRAPAGAVKPQAAQKPSLTTGTRRTAAAGKAVLGDKNAGVSTAATRKRSAFSDVTNGTKAKAGTSAAAGKAAKATTSQQPASSTQTRRTYRTRSSTGGATSAVKEPIAEDEEEELNDDAMAIDGEEEVKPARGKTLKRTASGTTKGAAAATRRPALAAKRTNTSTATARGAAAKPTKQTPPAVRNARLRRAEAEEKHRQALEELEAARLQEEQLEAELAAQRELEELSGRQAKKARTSEPEYLRALDDDEEEALAEEARVSKYETEVEARPKDEGWEDLDRDDEEDPLMVSAYVVEVYEYLRELELTTMPDPEYMSNQNEVTWKMRGILVDWLVEIHTKFRLLPETIFLAVNIIDRFLSVRVVSLVKFQLVGVTALFIAAKYEEVCCPSVQNFLYMTDGGYTDEEILKAERYILGIIGFNLSYPNPINFLRRISKADGYDIQSRTMAKYLMEVSIVDHRFMSTPPSLIAAGAAWLARKVLGKGYWDANLVHYSGYSEAELKPTAQLMLDYVVRTSPTLSQYLPREDAAEDDDAANPLQQAQPEHEVEHPNFIKKYGAKKFFKASTAMCKWAEEEYRAIEYSEQGHRSGVKRQIVPALLA
ncbi:G2/mitotic-specific cyclin [Rhodosporidiobolus nylandii]